MYDQPDRNTGVVDDVIEMKALLEETRERLRLVEGKLEAVIHNFCEGSRAHPNNSQVKHMAEEKSTSEDAPPQPALGPVTEVTRGLGAPALRTAEEQGQESHGEHSAESVTAEVQGIEQAAKVERSVEEIELKPESLHVVCARRTTDLEENELDLDHRKPSALITAVHVTDFFAKMMVSPSMHRRNRELLDKVKSKAFRNVDDEVEVEPSLWYISMLIGTWPLGYFESVYIVFLLLLNITVQCIFLWVVSNGLAVSPEERFDIEGFLKWRHDIAHDCVSDGIQPLRGRRIKHQMSASRPADISPIRSQIVFTARPCRCLSRSVSAPQTAA
mgnify:CR=1 FL=1|jgi:hypothetical protein